MMNIKNLQQVKKKCEDLMGEKITAQEWEFAVHQIESDMRLVNSKIYDETAYDMLITIVDFARRHDICNTKTLSV